MQSLRVVETIQTAHRVEKRLSVTNLSSENNFADVSTECSSRHQGESERSVKQLKLVTDNLLSIYAAAN